MHTTVISIIVAVVLIGGAVLITKGSSQTEPTNAVHNVSVVGGKQIVEITAKGGYSPRKSIAKAGMPTILRFDTNGTFDCSSSVRIPTMNISKVLPQSGITDVDIGNQQIATLAGTCGMGMYPFEVDFQG